MYSQSAGLWLSVYNNRRRFCVFWPCVDRSATTWIFIASTVELTPCYSAVVVHCKVRTDECDCGINKMLSCYRESVTRTHNHWLCNTTVAYVITVTLNTVKLVAIIVRVTLGAYFIRSMDGAGLTWVKPEYSQLYSP